MNEKLLKIKTIRFPFAGRASRDILLAALQANFSIHNLFLFFLNFQTVNTTDSESDAVVLRRLPRSNGDNRLSLISNDSSISRDSRFSINSSVGSMSSNNDPSLTDSNSDLYGNKYSGYGLFMSDRHRGTNAIYSPSSDSQLETIVADDWPDARTGACVDDSQNTSDAKESDACDYGTLKPNSRSPFNRKFVSTSQLQSGTFLTPAMVDGTLVRAQSTITAVRVDDDGISSGLMRSNTCGTIVPLEGRYVYISKYI